MYMDIEIPEGKFLNYKLVDKKSEKIIKKYDEIDINWIKECYENKNMSYKDVSESFKHFRKKNISPTIVSKILNNNIKFNIFFFNILLYIMKKDTVNIKGGNALTIKYGLITIVGLVRLHFT